MADKLCLGQEVRELKLGSSFFNKSKSFHTIRYDFKPASVDLSKVATVDVGSAKQVTVTVPHLDGADISHTVFKGSQRPYQKQCVLIYDKTTGEITLEKLSCNIQVKKTRKESVQKALSSYPLTSTSQSSSDAVVVHKDPINRPVKQKKPSKSHQVPSSLSGCIPQHSPLHASPSSRSPTRSQHKSPPQSNSISGSLPMIGMDDIAELEFGNENTFSGSQLQQDMKQSKHSPKIESQVTESHTIEKEPVNAINILPDSSSDSSSYSSSSDSDSESEMKSDKNNAPVNKVINTNVNIKPTASLSLSMPDQLLSNDLLLSESGSDSD